MNEREARLLRALAGELSSSIAPLIESGSSREHLRFAQMMLSRMAADIDIDPAVLGTLETQYESALSRACIAAHECGPCARPLRDRAAQLIEQLADQIPSTEVDAAIAALVKIECERRSAYDQAANAIATAPAPRSDKRDAHSLLTRESVSDYFRVTFKTADLEVSELRVLPGGRSKYTVFLTLTGGGALPDQLVMRQDTGSTHIPTHVAQEHPLLAALASRGLPVPRPLHLEPLENPLGGPFMLVERVRGEVAGDYFTGFKDLDQRFAIDLARALGAMHSLDIATAGIEDKEPGASAHERWISLVRFYRERWRKDRLESSPLVESAYAWLLRQLKRPLGKPVVVHGDCAPHNLLKHDGRLAAILDWELSHIGDAGEDLGYCRRTVERLLPWNEFMVHYRAAGGADVDERQVLMGNIWGHLRNSTFSAGSAREFHDGRAGDFAQGAFGYFVLPRLEMLLAPLLERAWHLETKED
jgi:aminoglycoside phosphotransferase (APT) family kinase protein